MPDSPPPSLQLFWVTSQSLVALSSAPSFCLGAKSFHQWEYPHHLLKSDPSSKEQVIPAILLPFPIPQAFCTMLAHPFSHLLPSALYRHDLCQCKSSHKINFLMLTGDKGGEGRWDVLSTRCPHRMWQNNLYTETIQWLLTDLNTMWVS